MKTIYHFFRLIRTINLLVIGLTMFVVEMFILRVPTIVRTSTQHFLSTYKVYSDKINVFWFLLVSTLLIAAAGNIINDYFDVKADRINKPNRLIIGKHIKRRWAMVLHWSFNSLGMIIALYVGYVLQNIWVPLIAFLSINLLWFYSAYYKRRPLIGNLIVALLIGIIPIYVLLINLPLSGWPKKHAILTSYHEIIIYILFVSVIAFLINLIRELVKDIQDIKGDLRLGAKTFPIKYGIRKSKYLVSALNLITISIIIFYCLYVLSTDSIILPLPKSIFANSYLQNNNFLYEFLILLFLAFLNLIISWVLLLAFNKSKTYKIASTLLKIAMLCGLLTPLFL